MREVVSLIGLFFLASCDITLMLSTEELFPPQDEDLLGLICRKSNRIFIGTMTEAESLWEEHPVLGRQISTDVVYEVERNIMGAPDRVEMRLMSGRLDGMSTKAVGWPWPNVGERHYLAVDLVEAEEEFAAQTYELGTPFMVYGLWINPHIFMPSEEQMRADLRARCDAIGQPIQLDE